MNRQSILDIKINEYFNLYNKKGLKVICEKISYDEKCNGDKYKLANEYELNKIIDELSIGIKRCSTEPYAIILRCIKCRSVIYIAPADAEFMKISKCISMVI